MSRKLSFIILVLPLIMSYASSTAQKNSPVTWTIQADSSSHNEVSITIRAALKQGWRIYSQHINEGGPIPTQFFFNASQEYSLVGPVIESGNKIEHFDDNYEMNISWYTSAVTFTQNANVSKRPATITGRIEYMTCSQDVCYPQEKIFNIEIKPLSTTQ